MADTPTTGDTAAPGTGEPSAAPAPPTAAQDSKTPPATPPKSDAPATTEDGKIILDEKDYKEIISQRDRATEAAKSTDGQKAFVEQLAQERAIDDFLKDNKKDYPDLTREDLSHVWDPEQLKPEADRLQRRLQDHLQNNLMNVEDTKLPILTPQQRKEQEEALKKAKDPNAFEKMVAGRLAPR
jgi:hypothetical protein